MIADTEQYLAISRGLFTQSSNLQASDSHSVHMSYQKLECPLGIIRFDLCSEQLRY